MKKIITFILIIISTGATYSQQKMSSKLFSLVNGNEYATELQFYDNKYILLTNGICDPQDSISNGCTSLLSLDEDLHIISNHTFVDWMRFAPPRPLKISEDTLYIFGHNQFTEPIQWNTYKTNIYGDSLGGFSYDDYGFKWAVTEGIQIKGDHIFLAGRTYHSPGGEDLIVLKMDKNGKLIKEERFYDIADPIYNNDITDFIQTSDGNFMLAFITLNPNARQARLIKFDENLDTIWSRNLNTRSYAYEENRPDLTPNDEGGVLMSWMFNISDDYSLPPEYWNYGNSPPTLFNIDGNGNTLWSDTLFTWIPKEIAGAPIKNIYRLYTTKEGDFIGVGSYRDFVENKNWAWLFKYSSTGVLLWEKIFEDRYYESIYSYFSGVIEDSNGNIVCAGKLLDENGEWNNASHTWLLRLDSTGCFEPGCEVLDTLQLIYTDSDLVSGIEELYKSKDKEEIMASLWPNPVYDLIRLVPSQDHVLKEWSLHQIDGCLIKRGNLEDSRQSYSISVGDLLPGFYLLKVRDEKGNRQVLRFVKE